MSTTKYQQGYGCMGLSAFYASAKTTSEEDAIKVVTHALSSGAAILNSANFYGPLNEEGFGHNLRLLRKCLDALPPSERPSARIMVKIGMDTKAPVEKTGTQWNLTVTPDALRADLDYCLEVLGVSSIDTVVLCRCPPVGSPVSIEEVVGSLAEFVKEGKAKNIALSEASADYLRRASKVAKIYAIEQEWSLWARDVEELGVVEACKELDIKIVAYSPLGRGFLTGSIRSREALASSDPWDFRLIGQPKFGADAFDNNLKLVDEVAKIAEKKGITTGQVALAWLNSMATKYGVEVIAIPGTSSISHLNQNLAARDMELTDDELGAIDAIFSGDAVKGERYAHMNMCFNAQVKGSGGEGH
jgi:aryl-alcohol dehydrogenase-like predicted oxidoreductase